MVARDRFIAAILPIKRPGKTQMVRSRIGSEGDGAVIARRRLIRSMQRHQRIAEVVMGIRIVRGESERLAE